MKDAVTLFPSDKESLGKCPRCGASVVEINKGFVCENRGCGFAIWKENKFFTAKRKKPTKALVMELLSTGRARLTGCYSEKTGKTYNATVVLDDTGGKYVSFKLEFDAAGPKRR